MRTFASALVLLFVLVPLMAQAQSGLDTSGRVPSGADTTGQNVKLINPLNLGPGDCSANNTCVSVFLTNVLKFVVQIGSIVVILMLVYVGFKFVTAQGKPGEIEAAKGMLLWTVIGALVLLGAQAIAMGIQATVEAFLAPS